MNFTHFPSLLAKRKVGNLCKGGLSLKHYQEFWNQHFSIEQRLIIVFESLKGHVVFRIHITIAK